MSGEWKRGTARLVRHRRTKGPETDMPNLNHRATPRLYRNLGGSHIGKKIDDVLECYCLMQQFLGLDPGVEPKYARYQSPPPTSVVDIPNSPY
jgi:hypothetical protein